jgi:hypothetical protein
VGQILPVAGREIIDAQDGVALGQQAIGQVRPEKSGGAGNKNAHIQNFKAPRPQFGEESQKT